MLSLACVSPLEVYLVRSTNISLDGESLDETLIYKLCLCFGTEWQRARRRLPFELSRTATDRDEAAGSSGRQADEEEQHNNTEQSQSVILETPVSQAENMSIRSCIFWVRCSFTFLGVVDSDQEQKVEDSDK